MNRGEDVATRLRQYIGEGHGKTSIRAFSLAMQRRTPRPRGSTRAMIHRYLDGAPPPTEFLTAAADILGVSREWLAFGTDHATEKHAAVSTAADSFAQREQRRREDAHRSLYYIRERVGIPQPAEMDLVNWRSGQVNLPYWAAPLAELRRRVWWGHVMRVGRDEMHEDDFSAERWIGDALRGPLDAFGLDPAAIDEEALGDYVCAMVPALLRLTPEIRTYAPTVTVMPAEAPARPRSSKQSVKRRK